MDINSCAKRQKPTFQAFSFKIQNISIIKSKEQLKTQSFSIFHLNFLKLRGGLSSD